IHRLASVATSSASHTGILSTPMAYGRAPRTSTPGVMVMKNICTMFLRRAYIFPVYGSPQRMQRERCKMLRGRGGGCSHLAFLLLRNVKRPDSQVRAFS